MLLAKPRHNHYLDHLQYFQKDFGPDYLGVHFCHYFHMVSHLKYLTTIITAVFLALPLFASTGESSILISHAFIITSPVFDPI